MATPTDFWLANWLFLKTAPQRVSGNYDPQDNLRFGKNIKIRPGAEVTDSVLGDNVTIEAGCQVANCVIGSNILLSGAKMNRTIVISNTRLPHFAGQIEDSVLGGHIPLVLDEDLSFDRIRRKFITRLPDGKILIDPLDIRSGEETLAVDCFKKLKFLINPDDNPMGSQ
jgi:NDP-sugar pyrophosphorylase family protein